LPLRFKVTLFLTAPLIVPPIVYDGIDGTFHINISIPPLLVKLVPPKVVVSEKEPKIYEFPFWSIVISRPILPELKFHCKIPCVLYFTIELFANTVYVSPLSLTAIPLPTEYCCG